MGYNGKKPTRLEVDIYDSNGSVGAASSILTASGSGGKVEWTAPFEAGLQGVQGITGTQGTQGIQGVQGETGTQEVSRSSGCSRNYRYSRHSRNTGRSRCSR